MFLVIFLGRNVAHNKRICEKCGKPFQPSSSNQSWCNKCLTKICLYCGKEFSIQKKTRFDTAKFCSLDCKHKYAAEHYIGENAAHYKNGNRSKVEFVCSNCGCISYKDKKQLDLWENNFCSRKCQAEFYRRPENKNAGEASPKYSKAEKICE